MAKEPRLRRGQRRRRDLWPWSLGFGILLLALVLPPVVSLIRTSIMPRRLDGSSSQPTLDYFAEFFAAGDGLLSAANTVVYSLGTVIVAVIAGGSLAWVTERTNARFRGLAYAGAIISLAVPHVLYTFAWVLFLGRSGPVNALLGAEVVNASSLLGMIWVEGLLWSPLAFLMLGATLRQANASYEEAARVSGASTAKTLHRITYKLSRPGVLAIALLVFVRAFESFEVPALLGLPGGVRVLTTDIYRSLATSIPPDYGRASAFAVMMLVLVGIMLQFYHRALKGQDAYSTVTGKSFAPTVLRLSKVGRVLAPAYIVLTFLVIIVAPFSVLIWNSLLPFYQPFGLAGLGQLSFENFAVALGSRSFQGAIGNTFLVSAGAATFGMMIAAAVAWLALRRAPGARLLDQIASFPLVFPGIVLGVAVLQTTIGSPIAIYGTVWVLILGLVIKFLPYGMRYSYAGALQIHVDLEDAARASGAGVTRTFFRVTLPLLMPSLIAGWIFIFLIASRELSTVLMLTNAGNEVVAVVLWDLWRNGQPGVLAALGLVWTGLMLVVAGVLWILSRRWGLRIA